MALHLRTLSTATLERLLAVLREEVVGDRVERHHYRSEIVQAIGEIKLELEGRE